MSASPDIPNKFARWRDVRALRRAVVASVVFTATLWWIKILEDVLGHPLSSLGVLPGQWIGLIGVFTAPLIHGSYSHLLANSPPLLILGTLSLYTYRKASRLAIPLIWVLSGLGTWFIGRPSSHIGASGLAHGLMFFVFTLGILRWEPRSIATALVAFLLYGGMVTTIFPRETGTSFEYHFAGAMAGVLAAILWRRRDPLPVRKKYSWELEEEQATRAMQSMQFEDSQYEPPRPEEVPVLWQRESHDDQGDKRNATVLPFRPRTLDYDDNPGATRH
jgi:membrane associated rhomboid family serine protease